MIITKESCLTGKMNTMDLPVTEEAIRDWVETGVLLQNAFPHLTPAEREFIKSGCTQEEWTAVFGNGDED